MERARRYFLQGSELTRRELQKPQLDPLIGALMFIAVFILLMLVALPLLSLRYGVDSRHFSTRERRTNW
jgi:hypothetical protein